ncbi:hypothetical protein [Streptomyces sp. NPDC002994]|uniref:hypothetical protein n=1 Tax=Streptomyces sp. NPDC002994 TaxID=3154441 RepID=UPI0033AD02DB
MALVNHTVAGASTKTPEGAESATVGDGELDYTLTTVPDPLTVSPESTVELADLILVGSRIHPDPIETNQIAVYVPIGSDAWQLVLDYTGLQSSINLTGWTATPDPANERILFKPSTGHATLTDKNGFSLHLDKLRINRQVGTAPMVVALNWRTAGSSGSFRTEEQTLSVGKFPPGFYLRNLKADSNYIDNGDSVTLTWERSTGATYTLLYEDKSIDVTNYSSFTVNNVKRNTMFYVEGTAQQGTGSATLRLSSYITVDKPDLEANTLDVHGEATVRNALSITGTMLNRQEITIPWPDMWSYTTAPTDGILLVQVETDHVILDVGCGEVFIRSQSGLPGKWSACTSIPVPKGQRIKLRHTQHDTKYRIDWFGFGDIEIPAPQT